MADECCDDIVGGLVYITYGDKRYEATGDVRIFSRQVAREANATAGGKMMAIERAVLARAEITFVNRCSEDPIEIFDGRCRINVTIVEASRRIRHLFTRAVAVGEPEINLASGELSGITIASDTYTRSSR